MKKSLLIGASLVIVAALLYSFKPNEKNNNKNAPKGKAQQKALLGTFTDSRDGKTYKTVKIGDQVWLAENFAFKPKTGKYGGFDGNYWAYDDKDANVAKHGYLYDYKTALQVVPKGWHLPTKAEFESLLNHYGGGDPFQALTSDKNGLNIVYSGWYYQESMAFSHGGNEVGYWSSTKDDDKQAWLCILQQEWKHVFIRTRYMEGVGAAVRLVKDKTAGAQVKDAEPSYTEFKDETPKTVKGNYTAFLKKYNQIIEGKGYTVENPDVKRMFTNVKLKKKDGKVKMVEIVESDRNYENKWQFFYKNNQLFYAYIMLSYSDGTDDEGMLMFTKEERKYYFNDNTCTLFLFSNSSKDKNYPEYESKWKDILKEGNEHLQRSKTNKWNEF